MLVIANVASLDKIELKRFDDNNSDTSSGRITIYPFHCPCSLFAFLTTAYLSCIKILTMMMIMKTTMRIFDFFFVSEL